MLRIKCMHSPLAMDECGRPMPTSHPMHMDLRKMIICTHLEFASGITPQWG
uniref:Uncharacterized protein n=1 Tax=Arundo donax TaxID=35708 RepID=A0A0A9EMS5_ARUDO